MHSIGTPEPGKGGQLLRPVGLYSSHLKARRKGAAPGAQREGARRQAGFDGWV